MHTVRFFARELCRGVIWILAIILLGNTTSANASGFDKLKSLSEREKTFLRHVFDGDEAKAVDYAQAAGINVNAIAGEPLSVWFYRLGMMNMGRAMYRELPVQRLVFERFRQNPNPPNVGDTNLEYFCNFAPYPKNIFLEGNGTPEQRRALQQQYDTARQPHIEAMGAGINSLLLYGLRDKSLLTAIFMGCMFRNAAPLNAYVYDTVLSPLVKAGANINAMTAGGERPIQNTVSLLNADVTERLIRDGAEVKFLVRPNGFLNQPVQTQPCAPRLDVSLYQYLFKFTRPRDPEPVVKMVGVLASAGLSPMAKYGFVSTASRACKFESFHDTIIDTGDLAFANAVKAAAEVAPTPKQQAQPTATRATAPLKETQIGEWRIIVKDGRSIAMAKAVTHQGDQLAGLNLECVPGGRLEYLAVALKLFDPIRSLWINSAGDVYRFNLANGRASGTTAVAISKQVLAEEAANVRQGSGEKWTLEMSIDSDNGPMSEIQMGGFSKMRSYMLANCKN